MNVWLWGPVLWPILHMTAYKADHEVAYRKPFGAMIQAFRVALPCIYCKRSYNDFLDQLGDPPPGQAFEWIYTLHEKVNAKLDLQRIDKLRDSECGRAIGSSSVFWDHLKRPECRRILFNEPSFEVVTKRAIITSPNPFTERDIVTVLLVLNLHAQGPDTSLISSMASSSDVELLEAHRVIAGSLLAIAKRSDASASLIALLKSIESSRLMDIGFRVAKLARYLYPDERDTDIVERIRLFRAGACLNGSCV